MDPSLTFESGIRANLRKFDENVSLIRECLENPEFLNTSHKLYCNADESIRDAIKAIFGLKEARRATHRMIQDYPEPEPEPEPRDCLDVATFEDRPAHGGYPTPGPALPMTGVPNTLAALQRSFVAMEARDAEPRLNEFAQISGSFDMTFRGKRLVCTCGCSRFIYLGAGDVACQACKLLVHELTRVLKRFKTHE